MKRVLFIIAPSNFRDEELEEPKGILEDAGCICDIASTITGPVRGMLGLLVRPRLTVDNVEVENYDAVVVVGGGGSPALSTNEKVLQLIQKASHLNKVIGSICFGSLTTARAGVLKGKKGTGWKHPDTLKAFQQNNAEYVDESVVVDGKIVTAQGPHVAAQFGKKLLELLQQ